jgi:polyhydroxybutyrate depolymerase
MLRQLLSLVFVSMSLSGFAVVDTVRAQSNAHQSVGCDVTSAVVPSVGAAKYDLESGGVMRSYLLYVPETFDSTRPTPLVLTFHGFAGWPQQQMENSNWRQVAEEYGFLVVYPAGTGFPLRWQIGQNFNESDEANDATNDLIFIRDLLDTLSEQFCLDLNRVYANGLSNGGGMTYLLACEMADRFAAVGTVAGAYVETDEGCRPSRPVPMITFHGTDDQTVPYEGLTSRRFNFPRIADWVADWAARNGCDDTPEVLPEFGDVSGVEYTGCEEDADVVFYTINGGGHAWPGGDPMPRQIVGETTQDIDASAVMWEFFERFSLQQ